VRVRIHRLRRLVWVVDEVLALEWRRWVYGRVCRMCGCQLRCWLWTGKGGEGGIQSCMSEYTGAGVGGGRAYRSEERVLVVAKWALSQWAVCCWRIKDCGDGDRAADGTCKRWPPWPMFTPASPASLRSSPEQGCDGEWRGATADS